MALCGRFFERAHYPLYIEISDRDILAFRRDRELRDGDRVTVPIYRDAWQQWQPCTSLTYGNDTKQPLVFCVKN